MNAQAGRMVPSGRDERSSQAGRAVRRDLPIKLYYGDAWIAGRREESDEGESNGGSS